MMPDEPILIDTVYRPSEAEPFMNDRQREYFRRKLVTWKQDIIREANETIAALQSDGDAHSDLADRASAETDRAIELRARDRQRKLISKIDAALSRIDEGTYGFCEETGEPISLRRLMRAPPRRFRLKRRSGMSGASAFIATTSFEDFGRSPLRDRSGSAIPASADDRPYGVWQGTYLCNQGETLLRLTVLPTPGVAGELLAYFYFTPRPDADDRSAGCFTMHGRIDSAGAYSLTQAGWIRRPFGYVMVDLEGRIDADGRYTGIVSGPGCGSFDLRRVLDRPDESTACEPLSQ